MSCCRWTAPFGNPVVPELYSQKHASSGVVSAGSSSSSAAASASSNETTPSCAALPVTMTCRRRGRSFAASSTFGRSGSDTTIATARVSSRM